MIIEEKILVSWNGMNRKHYESFGYVFTKKGDSFTVLTTQLPKSSHVFIKDKCENCGDIVIKEAYRTTKYCQPCTGKLVISKIAKDSYSNKLGNENIKSIRKEKMKIINKTKREVRLERLKTNPPIEKEKIRKTREYNVWCSSVRWRDKSVCQYCLTKVSKNANKWTYASHHLNGFCWAIEQRFDVDNGIFLCKGCHDEFHKLYSKRVTKEMFFEWMSANFMQNFLSLEQILGFNKQYV